MIAPEVTLEATVTAASATSVTLTPTVDTWDRQSVGAVTTVTIAGTGLKGFATGNRVRVRING